MSVPWQTVSLAQVAPVASPGGAEIRELPDFPAGRLSHATVPAGRVSTPAVLTGVVEIFHGIAGTGSLWLAGDDAEQVVGLHRGRSVVIPAGVSFQYRAGADGLRFLVATMPRWRPEVWSEAASGRWRADGSDSARGHPGASDNRAPWTVTEFPDQPLSVAPDGSDVRPLARADDERGSLAHFALAAGTTSTAVRHHELEEVWFFLAGTGEMWRDGGDPVVVEPGIALTIPARVAFQFRSAEAGPLEIIGLTLPAWPLDRPLDEVIDTDVEGPWKA